MYRCWLPLCHCHRLVHTHRAVGVVDAVGRAGRWRRSKNRSDADNFARHGCAMFGKRCLDALIDKGREPVIRRRELLFITHDRPPLDYDTAQTASAGRRVRIYASRGPYVCIYPEDTITLCKWTHEKVLSK